MRPLLILTLLTGSANAACTVQQSTLTLPEYSAVDAPPATGTLSVSIKCGAKDTARLYLSGPGQQVSGPDLKLQLRSGNSTLSLVALSAAALQNGLLINGTQTLTFKLQFPQGQWVPVGAYNAAMTLTLVRNDH